MYAAIGNEKCADTTGTVRFPGLAISNAKILTYFSNKIYSSNFIKTALGNCYGVKLLK